MSNKDKGLIDPDKPLIDQLGTEVTLEKEELDIDHGANEVLHRIGKSHCPQGLEYCGTIGIMLYVEKSALAKGTYSIASITNIAMKKDLSEALVATALNNATIDIRTHFNPQYKFKTNRKNDKRGIVK